MQAFPPFKSHVAEAMFAIGSQALAQAAQVDSLSLSAMQSAQSAVSARSFADAHAHHHNARRNWRLACAPSPVAQGVRFHHYASDARALSCGPVTVSAATVRRTLSRTPSDSGVNWALFIDADKSDVLAWCEANGWVRRDVHASHDCSGQYFARSVSLLTVGRRTLATQLWGHDI